MQWGKKSALTRSNYHQHQHQHLPKQVASYYSYSKMDERIIHVQTEKDTKYLNSNVLLM